MHSCRPGDSPFGRSLMGARHERSVLAGPSARQAPEKRAVHAFTPLERTLGVDADMADLLSIATWTRGRRVNDESGTGRGERTHGFLSGHAMVRNPWNDGRLRTAGRTLPRKRMAGPQLPIAWLHGVPCRSSQSSS